MKYYTTKELAELFQVHPETIKREVQRRNLQCFKVGTELRFSQEQVDEYTNVMNQGKTTREIELEKENAELRETLFKKESAINSIKNEVLKCSGL